jgi:alkylation response protein AidB-like acyl-CoA dehydrogenase
MVGDLPGQDFLGWMAVEIEYEPLRFREIVVALRTQKIIDPRLVEWGPEGGTDEAFHREFITVWWRRYLSHRSPSVREEIVGRMLEYAGEYRKRKGEYYQRLREAGLLTLTIPVERGGGGFNWQWALRIVR